MKQFIYLDVDLVNSILAQKEKGLVSEITQEQQNSTQQTNGKSGKADASVSGEGGFSKLARLSAGLVLSGSISNEAQAQSLLREVATKTLHDAAFDIAYTEISSNYNLAAEQYEIGSFIEVKSAFSFIDLGYFVSLFEAGGLIDFLKKTEKQKIQAEARAAEQTLTTDQRRRTGATVKRKVQEAITTSMQPYDDIAEVIRVIKSILPYERMLLSQQGLLVPLEDAYFRDNPKTMGFKHGGELTCVGYITNVISEISAPMSEDNVFAAIQYQVNLVLKQMVPTQGEDLWIVHPLALYYGE